MHSGARNRIAAAQLELVRALVSNDAAPAEFDRLRIQATAEALLLKRAHSVARTWPALARALGPTFDERFAQYARSEPISDERGPLADGRAFARSLACERALSDEAALETIGFDLRYRVGGESVRPRRGVSLCAKLLKQPRRLIIAVRLPVLGERWIKIPLKI